ncbi:MAG: metallophosphoesterase [Sedimentisphaerales bacterium]|nr:metallophosphoesterase [Sedimentisphaerales bacterium]
MASKTKLTFALFIAFFVAAAPLLAQDVLVVPDLPGAHPWTNLNVNTSPENFQFVIVSDRTGACRPGVFSFAMDQVNLLQPEFVICVGDLIEGYTEDVGLLTAQWDEFDQIVGKLQMPFLRVGGNHDLNNPVQLEIWQQRYGPDYYHFRYHDVLFIVISSERFPSRYSSISSEQGASDQLAYIQDVLNANQDVRWTMLLMHRPLWNTSETTDVWAQIETMLADRHYTAFAGHHHTYDKTVSDSGANLYTLATTGGGSDLTGVADGSVDHIVWVTMTDEQPIFANLLLEGILNDNLSRREILVPRIDPVLAQPTIDINDAAWESALNLLETWQSTDTPLAARIFASPQGLQIGVITNYFARATANNCGCGGSRIWNDPCIEIFLGKHQETYAHLIVNSANTQFEQFCDLSRSNWADRNVDYQWQSVVVNDHKQITYSVTIPWSTLAQIDIAPGDTISFNLGSTSSMWDWSGLTGGSYHTPSRFGSLTLPELTLPEVE